MDVTADRVAILDLLARYARGVDRCDEAVLAAVWAPGATVDYGNGELDAVEWSKGLLAALRANFLRTQHMIGQSIIDLDGTMARAETYCRAYHELNGQDGPIEMIVGGRYLDELRRDSSGWRITHRRYVLDWNQNGPSTAQWDGGLYATLNRRAARAPDDPSYTGA